MQRGSYVEILPDVTCIEGRQVFPEIHDPSKLKICKVNRIVYVAQGVQVSLNDYRLPEAVFPSKESDEKEPEIELNDCVNLL